MILHEHLTPVHTGIANVHTPTFIYQSNVGKGVHELRKTRSQRVRLS